MFATSTKLLDLIVTLQLCCLSLPVFAQELARQNIAPEAARKNASPPETAALFPYRPPAAWEGQRFIFLSYPRMLENGAYDDFTGARKRKDYVGKVIKVVTVSNFSGRIHAEFELEESGERLRARTMANKESLKGLLLVEDLENARKQWVGQTLWCKQTLLSTYDEASDTMGSIALKRYAPVKVIEITPGWDEEKPLRFVLECGDGRRGFIDLNLSGTNVQSEMRQQNRFEASFLIEDPKLLHKWPANIWQAIETNRVIGGMTMEQVQMSWGEPEQIARTAAGERWTYAAGVLTFSNGKLVGIQ